MATQNQKLTGRQANKLATDPKVQAAVLQQLIASGQIPAPAIVPPAGPVSEDTETGEASETVDPELLRLQRDEARETEDEAADMERAHDAGLASMTQVGDVPPPVDAPHKDEDTPDKLDAKDQTPAIPRYHVVSDSGDDKERYKLLYARISLSAEDKKLAKRTAHEYIDQEFGKGGRSELAAALQKVQLSMSQTAYMFALRASRNSSVPLYDAQGALVMDEEEGKAKERMGEDVLAWFDKIVNYAEEACRKEYREKHNGVDLAKASEVFGPHWINLKSQMRRSLRDGYDPRDFEAAGAFAAASKKKRKASGAAGQTNVNGKGATNADNPTLPPVTDDVIAAMHPALGAELLQLIKAAKSVAEIHAIPAAQIIHDCMVKLKEYAAIVAPVMGQDATKEATEALRQDAANKGAGVVDKAA